MLKIERDKARQGILVLLCLVLLFKDILPGVLDRLLMILLLGVTVANNHFKLVKDRALAWCTIYAGFTLVVVILTSSDFSYFLTVCFSLVVILTTSQNIKKYDDLKLFLKAYAIAGVLFCTYLLIVYHDKLGFSRFGNGGMLTGTKIDSSIALSYYLISIACVLIFEIYEERNKILKGILIVGLCECAMLTLFSAVRKAILIPIAFFIIYAYKKNKKHILAMFKYAIVLIVIAIIGVSLIQNIPELNRNLGNRLLGFLSLNGSVSGDASVSERFKLAKTGVELFLNNIIGCGFDNTINYFRTHHSGISHPHNNYLFLMNVGGFLYLIVYYWGHVRVVYDSIKKKKILKPEHLMVFCYVILTLISDFATSSYNIVFYNIFVGIGLCMYRLEDESVCLGGGQ